MSDCQHSLGNAASNRMKLDRGRFLGSGMTQPRRRRTRMMVLSDGAVPWRLERWKKMVSAPASSPSSASCLRRRTISSSTSPAMAVGERCGRLERGTRPSSTELPVAGQEPVDPAGMDPVGAGQLSDRTTLPQVRLDQVAALVHRRPPARCRLCLDTSVAYVLVSDTLGHPQPRSALREPGVAKSDGRALRGPTWVRINSRARSVPTIPP